MSISKCFNLLYFITKLGSIYHTFFIGVRTDLSKDTILVNGFTKENWGLYFQGACSITMILKHKAVIIYIDTHQLNGNNCVNNYKSFE